MVVYLLAALVVVGIYLVWRTGRAPGEEAIQRWSRASLSVDEIAAGLAQDDPETLGHALTRLQLRLGGADGGLPEGFIAEHWSELEGLRTHDDARVRHALCPVLAFAPDPRATPLLRHLLEDENPTVALNGAIALAARGDDAGAGRLRAAIEGLRGEQNDQRRALLMSFRHVARAGDRDFVADEIERARLDRDQERLGYCQDALARLDGDRH